MAIPRCTLVIAAVPLAHSLNRIAQCGRAGCGMRLGRRTSVGRQQVNALIQPFATRFLPFGRVVGYAEISFSATPTAGGARRVTSGLTVTLPECAERIGVRVNSHCFSESLTHFPKSGRPSMVRLPQHRIAVRRTRPNDRVRSK